MLHITLKEPIMVPSVLETTCHTKQLDNITTIIIGTPRSKPQRIQIEITIYMCVCVCVCVGVLNATYYT